MNYCSNCNKKLRGYQSKYCSNSCQAKYQQKEYIQKWHKGNLNDARGILTKNISSYIRKYLEDKFNNKCCVCGWNQVNPSTGKVPLEIDHINGNAEDNDEQNLRIVCPNCHSLSPNFRNLNKGRGRAWRTTKTRTKMVIKPD